MNLHFEPVTEENRARVLALELLPGQEKLIESVPECLAEAETSEAWRPVGIYNGDELVGFSMYGRFLDAPWPAPRLWLDRLLIDRRFQGRGYGTAAVEGLLHRLFAEYDDALVYLSVYEVNRTAIRLYERAGFRFNGELDAKGERIMVCPRGGGPSPTR